MECKLELSIFRFDASTDFLPYYKKHTLHFDTTKSIHELLAAIKEEELRFDYPKDEFSAIKINHKALYTATLIQEVIEHFGTTLILEPLSTKRAIKDLIINRQDFDERFELIAPFVQEEDKKLFESYIIYHYASSVHAFLEGFLAEALFVFAYDMIQKYPQSKREILSLIADEQKGIFFHTKMCNKLYPRHLAHDGERKIAILKNIILKEMPHINPLVKKLSSSIDSL